jgi:hypothetical protein
MACKRQEALYAGCNARQVPYFVVINASVFTDEQHKNDYRYGVKARGNHNMALARMSNSSLSFHMISAGIKH